MSRISDSLSVTHRIYIQVASGALLMLLIAAMGLRNQADTLENLRTVYEDRAEPLAQLAHINRLRQENAKEIILAFQHDPSNPLSAIHDHPVSAMAIELNDAEALQDLDCWADPVPFSPRWDVPWRGPDTKPRGRAARQAYNRGS